VRRKALPKQYWKQQQKIIKNPTLDFTKKKCRLINPVSWRRVTRIKICSSRRGRALGGNNAGRPLAAYAGGEPGSKGLIYSGLQGICKPPLRKGCLTLRNGSPTQGKALGT